MRKISKEEEALLKEKMRKKKDDIMNQLSSLYEDGNPYFSTEWVKKRLIKKANN